MVFSFRWLRWGLYDLEALWNPTFKWNLARRSPVAFLLVAVQYILMPGQYFIASVQYTLVPVQYISVYFSILMSFQSFSV